MCLRLRPPGAWVGGDTSSLLRGPGRSCLRSIRKGACPQQIWEPQRPSPVAPVPQAFCPGELAQTARPVRGWSPAAQLASSPSPQDLKKYGATTVVRVCEVTYDKALLEKDGITVVVRGARCGGLCWWGGDPSSPGQRCEAGT